MPAPTQDVDVIRNLQDFDNAISGELSNNNHYIPPIEQRRIGEVLIASLDGIDYRSVFFTVPHGDTVVERIAVDRQRPVPLFFTSDEVVNAIANSRQKGGSTPFWSKRVIGRDADGLLHKFYGNIVLSSDTGSSFEDIYPNHTLGIIASRLSSLEVDYLRALHSPAKLPHEDRDSSAISWMIRAAIMPRHMLKPMETLDIEMRQESARLPDAFVGSIFSGRDIYRNSDGHLQLRPSGQNVRPYQLIAATIKTLRAHDLTQLLNAQSDSTEIEGTDKSDHPVSLLFDPTNDHNNLLNVYCEAVKSALLQREGLPKNVINHIVSQLAGQTLYHVPTHLGTQQSSSNTEQLATIEATMVSDEFLEIFVNLFFINGKGPEKVALGVVDNESGSDVEYVMFELDNGLLITVIASVLGGKNWVNFSQISNGTDTVNDVKQLIQQGFN